MDNCLVFISFRSHSLIHSFTHSLTCARTQWQPAGCALQLVSNVLLFHDEMASGYNNWNDKGFRSVRTMLHIDPYYIIHTTISFPLGYDDDDDVGYYHDDAAEDCHCCCQSCYAWIPKVYDFQMKRKRSAWVMCSKYVRDLLISNCTEEFNLLNIFRFSAKE